MQIENLNDKDVEKLQDFVNVLKESNRAITSRVYPMVEEAPYKGSHQNLIDRIDALEKKIDFIFGGCVLIDGKFVKVPKP